MLKLPLSRRRFLRDSALLGALAAWPGHEAWAGPSTRPRITHGVMSGDVSHDSAIVWTRADGPARVWVEWSTRADLSDAQRVRGPAVLETTDYTAKIDLTGLPEGREIHYRVQLESLLTPGQRSEPVVGRLRTSPKGAGRGVRFAWSGDLCGQGFGLDPSGKGLAIFDQLAREKLDFFLFSGDFIYADNPIQAELTLDDGRVWKNLTSPDKTKVAETLAEFRGNFRYVLQDPSLQAFLAQVPIIAQWDDHEVRNNWYPGQQLTDPRYTVRSCDLLAARANRALMEYLPVRAHRTEPERIYRRFKLGGADLIVLDLRTHRGPNPRGLDTTPSAGTALLGEEQLKWVQQSLLTSTARWKIIASDMPLGLIVPEEGGVEAVAAGSGAPVGREHEIARLLSYIKAQEIKNVVWLTADVHYAAAHHYNPNRAHFKDFSPFWEYVAGPLHAGTFGPNTLDDTFGPEVKFLGIPSDLKPNRPPSDGLQFYGTVQIDPPEDWLTVRLHDASGRVLYERRHTPE